jgi:hypothetical protein
VTAGGHAGGFEGGTNVLAERGVGDDGKALARAGGGSLDRHFCGGLGVGSGLS